MPPAVEFLIFGVLLILTRLIHCGCSSPSTTFVLERIGSTSNEKSIDIVARDLTRHAKTTFVLERIGSTSNEKSIDIVARDLTRHAHVFQSSFINGVVNYPLQGSSDAFLYGFYLKKVKLGSPPREYNLLIDTGSDTTWVKCKPCNGCPLTGATIETSYFDPHSSSSAETVSCSGHICKSVVQAHGCSSNSVCTYSIPYMDTTSSSGYYVADSFHFDTINGNSSAATANYSTTIIFGCTTNLAGPLTSAKAPVDGVFGLGNQPISVISQLSSRRLTPDVFSHCLKGEGGGILVFGEVVEPGMVYTPLVPSRPHYNLNLLSISISGQTVPIHRDVFDENGGTIVDSGTTYAYLAADAYDPFVTALVAAVPPSLSSFSHQGSQCFNVSSSLRNVLPLVSLNFESGASMVLKPEEYLLQNRAVGPEVWCVGFLKSQGLTILGELVLEDKIIVYDLARQRLGWVEYDCSSSVNVSRVPPSVNNSSQTTVLYPFFTASLCMILMLLFSC